LILAAQSAVAAKDTLRHISETERGERARRAAAGALVLRVVELAVTDAPDEFTLRRARAEVAGLDKSAEKTVLLRALRVLEDAGPHGRLSAALVSYACELETTRRLPEADAAITLALALDEGSGATALHAARLARKMGDRQRALVLYSAARDLDGGNGQIARLAEVGEAVVSDGAERLLGRVIRRALRAGDAESAAVGLEERAALRRTAGDRRGAARDLCMAAARYVDPVDRARAAHELAGAALSLGDAGAAREALLVALAWGDAPQKDHARTRLHTLARDLGDQVGMRRWRSFQRPSLVSLSAYRPAPAARSLAPRLLRWRETLGERAAG
jgi:tetratricopeptide (TPR) repeat protein